MENIKQDAGEEMMLKGQDKDGDVPEVKEYDEMKEGNAPAEAEAQAGKDAEIQEVTGEEEQLAGSTSTDVKADVLPVTEKEDSAEDGLGNRFVMNISLVAFESELDFNIAHHVLAILSVERFSVIMQP